MVNAQKLKQIADLIKKEVPELGFALVVYEFGDHMREFRYISNSQRVDMIQTFEALIAKWKTENSINN